MQSIVVFSHLRWDFVYQRPQHLMTRLARHRPVYFIEEPVLHAGPEYTRVTTPHPNVHVCTPHTPIQAQGFHDDQMPMLRKLVGQLVAERHLHEALAWLYTPMALPLLKVLEPEAVVYDCMDELSMFCNAPAKLLLRERTLLKTADLVFTGGSSLYRAK